ncbi:ABC transporter substrate-binding protein [Dehalococcoidia bacterium]|nr:ABC transporter substrate-binding protein [Dehalococcoidia bacterium]
MGQFRAKLSAAVTIIGILALVVSACGSSDSGTSGSSPGKPGAVPDFTNAVRGGVLKTAVGGDAPSWDLLRENTGYAYDPAQPAYDSLVVNNPSNLSEVVGQVAESWEVGDDGLTWTFKIREGITFVNGNAMTAHDVKWTYDAVRNPPEGVRSPWKSVLASIGSITVPDDHTLVVQQQEPDASLLAAFAAGIVIYDKEFVEAEGRERTTEWPPMGSGPFMSEKASLSVGVSVELSRRSDYWVDGRPYLDGIEVFIIPDRGTAFANFLTGSLNFGLSLKPDQADEAKSTLGDKVTLQETATDIWWSAAMNITQAPFNDIRVREAVAFALDKRGYIKAVASGLGKVSGFIAPDTGFDLPMEQLMEISGYGEDREGNLKRARQLLTDAGYGGGFKTTLLVRNVGSYLDSNVFMQAQLAEIGIDAEMDLQDSAQYYDLINAANPTWAISARAHRTPLNDPNGAYSSYQLCGGGLNLTKLCDDEVQRLYAIQNAAAGDPAARRQAVWELENYTLRIFNEPVMQYSQAIYAKHSSVRNHTFPVFYKSNRQFRDVWIDES